jgi:glycosyltransferase involved in cell wall biosynthesis
MKKMLKKYLPTLFKRVLINYTHNKIIKNYYRKSHSRNALLSYIVIPFMEDSLSHTNFFEAQTWAKILDELGYNIDIVDYRNTKEIDLLKYDLICGFGDVFRKYFENTKQKNIRTIYYGTGMHVCFQNQATLQRVKEVHLKKKVWLGKSARFVEKTWTHQTALVDGIVALGNDVCADSYKKYYSGKVMSVGAPFYKTIECNEVIANRKEGSDKHFLWFGSTGLIHKGLDLLLDYFALNRDLTLHVCGPIQNEYDFVNIYKTELYELPNIITHGFIDLKSQNFIDILKDCSFVIFPSCSEGGAPSVLTAIGNGALIPIITKETTISTSYEIWIESLDYSGIDKAITSALKLKKSEILDLQKKNYEYVEMNHSQNNYYDQLKLSVSKILDDKFEM